MREKWQKTSYKSKILFGLTAMFLLPAIILTVFSYTIIRKNIREQMDITADSTVDAVLEQLEKTLDNISTSYIEIAAVESVKTVITSDIGYQDYHIYADAIKRLEGPAYLDDYLRHFTLINLETGWVLSKSGMYSFSEADNGEEVLRLLEENPYRTAYLVNHTQAVMEGNLPHNTIDLTGAFLVFKLPVASSLPRSVLIVNLDMGAFDTMEAGNGVYDVTILDEENGVLLATDEMTAEALAEKAAEITVEKTIKLEDNKKIQIGAVAEDSRSFKYIVTYDSDALGRLNGQIISLVLALNAVILLAFVMIFEVGGRIYRPIQNLTNMFFDVVTDEKDKSDEILFIGKNIKNLADTVKNQKSILVNDFMSSLLSGTIREEETAVYLKELEIHEFPVYSTAALGFETGSEWDGDMELEQKLVLNLIEDEFSEEVKKKAFLASRVWERTLIFLIGGEDEEDLRQKVLWVKESLGNYLEKKELHNMRLGVSRGFHSLKHTYRARHEAAEALKSRNTKIQKRIQEELYLSFYEEITLDMERVPAYPLDEEAHIREMLDMCREKEICLEIDLFVEKIFAKNMSVSERRYQLNRLFLSMLQVLSDTGLPVEGTLNTEGEDLFLNFWQTDGEEEIGKFLKQNVAIPVIRALQEFRSTNSRYIRERVLQLIRKSKGDITLSECAEKLNYSANYLGRVLRCENNVSFTDYVAEQKFEYAKELLRETQRSIADIAQELNYTNTQNFIRFFNKRAGMSPGKYRQTMQEENYIE